MLKRTTDVLIASAAILVLSPLLLLLACLVWIFHGPPIIFRQTRSGKHGHPFVLLKFRSMRRTIGDDSRPLPDEQRLTTFGRWLRASSLDEIPEFWNVLTGDMSLVGPRPLLMEYLPLYTSEQARRHEVRPGITGWAQVNGRNSISWDDRFRLDVWYVDNQTFSLDLKILRMTLGAVLSRRGISGEGSLTMMPFRGSSDM